MAIKYIQKGLTYHPAFKVWKRLYNHGPVPSRIEILKEKTKLGLGTYRIDNVGPNNSAVIAKRCLISKVLNEEFIYEKILPQIPIPSLNFYGSIKESNEKFGWLFIEDAGEDKYCSFNHEHRNYGAHYLAILHKHSAHLSSLNQLPDRGTDYYFEHLKYSKENILNSMLDRKIKPKKILNEAYSVIELLILKWKDMENKCKSIPKTFVHGDCKGKNIRIKANNVTNIVMFDWEFGGYGFPLVDLSLSAGNDDDIDCFEDKKNNISYPLNTFLEVYWNSISNNWDNISKKDFFALFLIGRILRFIPLINWKSFKLNSQWIEKKTFIILESYISEISKCAKALQSLNY